MKTEDEHTEDQGGHEGEPRSLDVLFDSPVIGALNPRVTGDAVYIDLYLKKGDAPYEPTSSFGASIPTFENEAQAHAWYYRVVDIFGENVSFVLTAALRLLLLDAGRLALLEHGLAPYDKTAILRDHLSFEELIFRDRLKLEAGRPQKWSATDLTTAISEAMSGLPESQRTYPHVAKKLQEKYPDKAPKSGESLRKMVKALEINWMRLKKEAQKRKRS